MADKLLEVKNLSLAYRRGKKVLDNVSFTVDKGELVSLIGLNGSGKSTLLHAIVGLLKIDDGEIVRHSEDIFFVPQRSDLDTSFPLTVREFCDLFGKENFEMYLEEVGAIKLIDQRVGSLSGGQFQRVMIAVALSWGPELLLLDEPTSGIDLVGERSFYELIAQIRRKHDVAIVLVSHDIHLVMSHVDKVLCLSGHICCHGTPKEVEASDEFKKIFGPHLQPYVHQHDHKH